MIDNRVKQSNREEFDERGWTIINLGLTKKEIDIYQKSLLKVRERALHLKTAPRRVYYDHFFRFNIAAIELPFNSCFIDKNIIEFFTKIKLGSVICSIMKWDQTKCNLARLFCMSNFNYRGRWHRDYNNINDVQSPSSKLNQVIAALYLFDQSGFKVLKKEYDFGGEKSLIINEEIDCLIRKHNMPIYPPIYSYNVLKAPAGSVILINPLLLHQGTTYGSRLDYHLLFQEEGGTDSYKNSFQDFYVPKYLMKDFDYINNIDSLSIKSKDYPSIPFSNREKIHKRFINSIEYRIPLLNAIRQYKYFKNTFAKQKHNKLEWKPDFFSNSIWQRD